MPCGRPSVAPFNAALRYRTTSQLAGVLNVDEIKVNDPYFRHSLTYGASTDGVASGMGMLQKVRRRYRTTRSRCTANCGMTVSGHLKCHPRGTTSTSSLLKHTSLGVSSLATKSPKMRQDHCHVSPPLKQSHGVYAVPCWYCGMYCGMALDRMARSCLRDFVDTVPIYSSSFNFQSLSPCYDFEGPRAPLGLRLISILSACIMNSA